VNWRAQCGIVIPCLNEAGAIASLVRSVREQIAAVVVVDDGSRDDTAVQAASAGAVVLSHVRSRGKGAALRTGLHWLRQRGYAWALLMDGDGQHAPEDIPRLLGRAQTSGAAMVVGNRMDASSGMPAGRRWVNRWMSRRLSNLTGHPLPDTQCGFRLLRLARWAALDWQTTHFEVESELLVRFLEARERVEFVPIRVIYNGERTKICPLLDAWRWCRWYWSVRKERVTGAAPVFGEKSPASVQLV
jgi:glycosyltransferase involved in cell wall biosynthesis